MAETTREDLKRKVAQILINWRGADTGEAAPPKEIAEQIVDTIVPPDPPLGDGMPIL